MENPTAATKSGLCTAVGALQLVFLLSDAMSGGQASILGAAIRVLIPVATITFFLAVTLNYVHLRRARNRFVPGDAVSRLTETTLVAALVTAVLGLFVVVVAAFNADPMA